MAQVGVGARARWCGAWAPGEGSSGPPFHPPLSPAPGPGRQLLHRIWVTRGAALGCGCQARRGSPPWRPLPPLPDLPHLRVGFPAEDSPSPNSVSHVQVAARCLWGATPNSTTAPIHTPQGPTKATGSQKEGGSVAFILRPFRVPPHRTPRSPLPQPWSSLDPRDCNSQQTLRQEPPAGAPGRSGRAVSPVAPLRGPQGAGN